jgi:protein-S-isoprenylcysteine O-methyltransferase Ste14
MTTLELKIPPVAVALLIALAMWCARLLTPGIEIPFIVRIFTGAFLAMAGAGISIAGVVSFRRAQTTVNPTKPNSTSALVTSGIYAVTRNPMYLGFLLMLCGWASFLSNALSVTGIAAFILYMNRFQIAPEEAALSALFGADFSAYKTRVRRWL